jgi:glucose/arabinose dehydrogenase
MTTGDAANGGLAQDLGSLAGKILRLNRDGTTPRTNPFGSPIYSYGHRNPQGLDWHPVNGSLWATEHGNVGNDELNAIDAGANYGWPRIEAMQTMAGMRTPMGVYNPTVAPSGVSFYSGNRFPRFTNNLFIATLRGTVLLRVTLETAPALVVSTERLLDNRFGRLRDVVTGPGGLLYLATNNRDGRGTPSSTDDRILRLTPAP